jgi:hypothetical protein
VNSKVLVPLSSRRLVMLDSKSVDSWANKTWHCCAFFLWDEA